MIRCAVITQHVVEYRTGAISFNKSSQRYAKVKKVYRAKLWSQISRVHRWICPNVLAHGYIVTPPSTPRHTNLDHPSDFAGYVLN
eukprot:m.445177 g.445177  ORF g.445177 m.445177 type:complete len:85 (+) comp21491_c0_seq11:3058-3312(+)